MPERNNNKSNKKITSAKPSNRKNRNARTSNAPSQHTKVDPNRNTKNAFLNVNDVLDSTDMPVYGQFSDASNNQASLSKNKGRAFDIGKTKHEKRKEDKKSKKIDLKAKNDPPHCNLRIHPYKLNLLTQIVGEYQAAKKVLNLEMNDESCDSGSSDSESEADYVKNNQPKFISRKQKYESFDGFDDDFVNNNDNDSEDISIEDLESENDSNVDEDSIDFELLPLDADFTKSKQVYEPPENRDNKGYEPYESKSFQNRIDIHPEEGSDLEISDYEVEQQRNPCETYLTSLGFSSVIVKQAAKMNNNNMVEALSYSIENEIGNMGKKKRNVFNVTITEAKKTREEEKEFLSAVYIADFQEHSDDHWVIFITPSFSLQGDLFLMSLFKSGFLKNLKGGVKTKVSLVIDVKFGKHSCYPYEAPIITVTEKDQKQLLSISAKYKLMLELNRHASETVGEPMVYNLVDWLTTHEADLIVQSQMMIKKVAA
ncbi:hypothetical protein HK096_000655, partial [Nowakowskiella sp. JEL0078]